MKESNQNSNQVFTKSKTTNSKIGNSFYVINNSLISVMNPKRTSVDISFFLQMNRKKNRKSFIDKQFETGLDMFSHQQKQIRKGFKGSLMKSKQHSFNFLGQNELRNDNNLKTHERKCIHSDRRNINLRTQFSEQFTKKKKDRLITYQQNNSHLQYTNPEFVKIRTKTAANHQRPNLMYNLNLYRKKYKQVNFSKNQQTPKTISNRPFLGQSINQSRTQKQFKTTKNKISRKTVHIS